MNCKTAPLSGSFRTITVDERIRIVRKAFAGTAYSLTTPNVRCLDPPPLGALAV